MDAKLTWWNAVIFELSPPKYIQLNAGPLGICNIQRTASYTDLFFYVLNVLFFSTFEIFYIHYINNILFYLELTTVYFLFFWFFWDTHGSHFLRIFLTLSNANHNRLSAPGPPRARERYPVKPVVTQRCSKRSWDQTTATSYVPPSHFCIFLSF